MVTKNVRQESTLIGCFPMNAILAIKTNWNRKKHRLRLGLVWECSRVHSAVSMPTHNASEQTHYSRGPKFITGSQVYPKLAWDANTSCIQLSSSHAHTYFWPGYPLHYSSSSSPAPERVRAALGGASSTRDVNTQTCNQRLFNLSPLQTCPALGSWMRPMRTLSCQHKAPPPPYRQTFTAHTIGRGIQNPSGYKGDVNEYRNFEGVGLE